MEALKRPVDEQLPRAFKRRRRSGSGSDSSDESVYSVQQQDTDRAKDTSDSDISDMTEYEVAHGSPEGPNPFFSTEDSDELEELNEIVELGAVVAEAAVNGNLQDMDLGILADTSTEPSTSPTSNSDADPELPRQDYLDFWTCSQCKAVNENRHVPFCKKCYTLRKTFFPPRPRRRGRPKRPSLYSRVSSSATTSGSTDDKPSQAGASSSQDVDEVDGPIRSQSSSQTDSGVEVDVPGEDKCQTCLLRPANGLFAHGSSAHRYSCYRCAKLTWRRIGRCPLCRRKIDRVIRLL